VSAETQKKRIAGFIATEWSRLVGYVRTWIADTAERDAEDVVQDVLERLFEQSDLAAPITDISAYFYRSLRNRVIDLYRKKKGATVELSAEVADMRFEASEDFERTEDQEEMFEAIDALPEPQREVLVATELEGRTFRELAEEWDVPIGTLLARKHRAMLAVRETLTGGTE
jgi:RNA polymerase sigma factor (sigma-70 family)